MLYRHNSLAMKPLGEKLISTTPSLDSLVYVLRVDLVFTVDSPKSVSCDAMTNVGSCLDENS